MNTELTHNRLRPLTGKEKQVLEFIESFMGEEGIAPSFTEIKDHFGFASYNSVQRYLKQLQRKNYIHIPGGNQKRAITILKPSSAVLDALTSTKKQTKAVSNPKIPLTDGPFGGSQSSELLHLPMLGQVAAGLPLEDIRSDEFTEVPPNMVRRPKDTFTLRVKGQSMIDDGIFDGDTLIIQEQKTANNGDIVVATVDNEATVKRFYMHKQLARPQVELRPANPDMESMWYSPNQVEIRGIVVGLLRKF